MSRAGDRESKSLRPVPGPERRARAAAPLRVAAVASLLVLLSGCEVGGFIAHNVLPRPKIKAVYHPIDQPTVIFVDDRRHAVPSSQLLSLIAARAESDLREEKVISEVVPSSKVDELRSDEEFDTLPIDEVGRRAGARQVIYVLIDAFDPGGSGHEVRRPTAAARIKVVDVQTGKALFPQRLEHGVSSTLFFKQPPIDEASHGRQTAISRKLAERLGRDIAMQFYEHEAREVGSGFDD